MAATIQSEEVGFVKKGKGFHLICRPGSKVLIVIFSGTGKRNGTFDFWGAAHRSPENVLLVNDAKNWWYQDGVQGLGAGIEATLNSIYRFRDMVGADRIVTVGASMGGYGAVLYGALMDADVLAFSFDSVLRLPTSPSEKHMRSDAPVVYPDLLPVVSSTASRIQIYAGEMYTMDIVGAQRLASLPNVTVTTLRGVWHDTARHLNLAIGIDQFIDAVVKCTPLPATSITGTIIDKPQTVAMVYHAHVALERGAYAECEEIAGIAITSDPLNEAARFLLGKALLMQKRPDVAAVHFGFVAAALPDYEDGQFYFAHALRLAKSYRAALTLFERQVSRWPTARAFCNLALAFEAVGDFDQAEVAMRKSIEVDKNYAPRLERMLARRA